MYTVIDMQKDPRFAQYVHFNSYEAPFLQMTVKTDVTDLVRFCGKRHFSFYAAMTRIAVLAANRVPELRRRICGSEVREYDACAASITELGPYDIYYYCTLEPKADWETFIPYSEAARQERRKTPELTEDMDADRLFFISCTPTLHYEQLNVPTDRRYTNPMITWGRYEEDRRGRLMLPLSLACHHALADGYHVAVFYKNAEEEIGRLPL